MPTTDIVEPVITPLWQTFLATGSSTVLLLIAIKWLVAGQDKLITSLEKERTERINDLDERLQISERHTAECNEDRKMIRERFIEHLERNAKMPLIVFCLIVLSSCSWQVKRSYSIYLEDQRGRRAGAGVVIEPVVKHAGK